MNLFLCGSCCNEKKYSLQDRIEMSQALKIGCNVCTQCYFDVHLTHNSVNLSKKR